MMKNQNTFYSLTAKHTGRPKGGRKKEKDEEELREKVNGPQRWVSDASKYVGKKKKKDEQNRWLVNKVCVCVCN